jgi:hypothetical protein
MKEFAGIERELRNQLKDTLPPELDAQRYNKAEQFKKKFKDTLPSKEKKDYEAMFGETDYQELSKKCL